MPDLFDPARVQFAVKADVTEGALPSPAVRYLQAALNRLCVGDRLGRVLAEDGQPGPLTMSAVARFQEHQGLPRSGRVDQVTWNHVDWCVYDGWTPAPVTLSRLSANSTAINRGLNRYTGQPVNVLGLTREAARLSDVTRWLVPTITRPNYAVDRNARGTQRLSRHALGLANDDMTDLDRDGTLELSEWHELDMLVDLLLARANGWPVEWCTIMGQRVPFQGPDRLATAVIGNHLLLDGKTRRFKPVLGMGKTTDWSWTPARGTWKRLTGKVHVNHLHLDVAPGAPKWAA